jgi:hypothetical protein
MNIYLVRTLISYIYAVADGRPISSVPGENSKGRQDRYVPADFMVLDMEIKEEETPLFWEDRSSTLPMLSSTLDLDKSTSNFQKKYTLLL